MLDTELAWELADAAQDHLPVVQRNQIYIAIASGDAFWAATMLLQTIVRSGLAVRADLASTLLGWVASYRDHPEQVRLQHLIRRVRIQPSDPPRGVPAPPTKLAMAESYRPANRGKQLRSSAAAMWTLVTSDGRRLANIASEDDARRTVHSLGTTRARGPFSWDVTDNQGRRFVAEISHRVRGSGS